VLNSSADQFILNNVEFHERRDGAMYPKDPSGESVADAAVTPHGGAPRALLPVVLLALATVVSAIASLNVALPEIARDTHANQTELQWIVDAYALTFAAFLLPFGGLGDRFGRRRALVSGLAIFGAASVAALFVSDPTALIVLRGVLGLGAALVMPATLSILTTTFDSEHRERAVALWAGIAGASAVLGLLAAGVLLEIGSWQTVFGLNVVLATTAIVAVLKQVPESRYARGVRLDPVGAALSALALGALVAAIIEGPQRGWTDGFVLGGFAAGLLGLAAFVVWELRHPAPLLDPRIFRSPPVTGGALSLFVQFFAFFGWIFLALQYLQLVQGWSPLVAALCLVPMGMAVMASSRAAPKLVAKAGIARVAPVGLGLLAAGMGVLSLLEPHSSYWLVFAGVLLTGCGMGLATTPATTAIVEGLPRAKQGVASALNDLSRELGGALGIAVLGSLLADRYASGVADHTAGLPAPAAEAATSSVAAAQQVAPSLPNGADLVAAAQAAFADGLSLALSVAAIIVLCTAIAVTALLLHAKRPAGDQSEVRREVREAASRTA
jgi:EmrB/QacA subfamily drug resistance transporter